MWFDWHRKKLKKKIFKVQYIYIYDFSGHPLKTVLQVRYVIIIFVFTVKKAVCKLVCKPKFTEPRTRVIWQTATSVAVTTMERVVVDYKYSVIYTCIHTNNSNSLAV